MPARIQRQRTKGWRMPEGVVYVGRPSRWGNPHAVGDEIGTDKQRAAWGTCVTSATHAVALFRTHLDADPDLVAAAREHLAGRDLACWCPLGQPCHADVLLEIANGHDG